MNCQVGWPGSSRQASPRNDFLSSPFWAVGALAVCLHSLAVSAEEKPLAGAVLTRDAAWDSAFTRTSGWTGGDVAGSIDLGDGRTLWLFGDSWIGDVSAGRHAPGSRLVNNSLAVHVHPHDKPEAAPEPGGLNFCWGRPDSPGRATAWIVPDRKKTSSDAANAQNDWYWPTGGGIVVPGPDNTRRLILFLYRVRKGDRPGTAMNFQVVGTTMAVVDNAADTVEKWRTRQMDVAVNGPDGGPRNDRSKDVIQWGMAACTRTGAKAGRNDYVYVFGVRSGAPLNRRLVVARVSADHVERFDAWECYAGDERWSHQPADAKAIADGMVSEFSVERFQNNGRWEFLLVQSEPLFGARILARTAPRPEGPWSGPVAVHSVSEIENKPSLFTYAAKGHVHLSRRGEVLVTYIVNSHKFSELVNDATLYRPRFVRVPLPHATTATP